MDKHNRWYLQPPHSCSYCQNIVYDATEHSVAWVEERRHPVIHCNAAVSLEAALNGCIFFQHLDIEELEKGLVSNGSTDGVLQDNEATDVELWFKCRETSSSADIDTILVPGGSLLVYAESGKLLITVAPP